MNSEHLRAAGALYERSTPLLTANSMESFHSDGSQGSRSKGKSRNAGELMQPSGSQPFLRNSYAVTREDASLTTALYTARVRREYGRNAQTSPYGLPLTGLLRVPRPERPGQIQTPVCSRVWRPISSNNERSQRPGVFIGFVEMSRFTTPTDPICRCRFLRSNRPDRAIHHNS